LSAFTWPPDARTAASVASSPQEDRAGESQGEQIQAAVLVALFREPSSREPHVVLTRRRADLRRHAGEISFPGGRRDAEDAALLDTALREAEEEIGLSRSQVEVLGELPATSTFATRYTIHPFVGQIPHGVRWRPSEKEVDCVLELSLAAVLGGAGKTRIERRGVTFETDAYVVDDNVIWGATARILAYLFERLDPAAAEGERLSLR
jgi:8-oxo-dGTP pyrophosphatase MutT (NUDIX family)